jgi:S-formylglutathione hydrolase FrmB
VTVNSVGEIDITSWPFLIGGVIASVLLVVGLAVLLWQRRGRLALVLATLVIVLVNSAAGINASFDYFRTLGDVLGLPPSDELELAELLARHDVPAAGVITTVTIPPRASGFAARPATIYVPPAWFARPRPTLPVVMLLHGTPGTPQDWIDGGQAAATSDAYAAAHGGGGPILVMPDINGSLGADTECVDGPAGRAETYLTGDVPAFVREVFHTAAPGRGWAVAGLSEGGSCALMLALRHPTQFGTFGDYAGLAGPRSGDTNADTASAITALFAGSPAAFAAHEPAALLANHRFPALGGWFEVGDADGEPFAATQTLVPLARRAGITACEVVLPAGGHTFDVFAQAYADSLPWIAGRIGAGPPVSDPRCRA